MATFNNFVWFWITSVRHSFERRLPTKKNLVICFGCSTNLLWRSHWYVTLLYFDEHRFAHCVLSASFTFFLFLSSSQKIQWTISASPKWQFFKTFFCVIFLISCLFNNFLFYFSHSSTIICSFYAKLSKLFLCHGCDKEPFKTKIWIRICFIFHSKNCALAYLLWSVPIASW